MGDLIKWSYEVEAHNFEGAGQASQETKLRLKQLGLPGELIRRISIAMYEGEINMVIHAEGGIADVEVTPAKIRVVLSDKGKGIPDISLAMKEGFSTATDAVRDLGFGAGMGLPNMKRYSDNMEISSTINVGTVVAMEFLLNKSEAI